MKRIVIGFCLALLVTGFAAAQVSRGGTLYVAVKTVTLKSSTGFFASNRGTLEYGDRVTVLQVSGKFVEVRSATNSSLTGWTSSANLSARQVISSSTGSASAREVALAGKGFNQDVENSYKTQGNLNYADVDRVEAISVNEAELRRFLEEGRLAMGD
ncbi:MAG: hypothetical protein LBU66_05140 [Treponema sp.]|jgi:hypothetical protein|nr:hypothetical protein [Treponema sp.]